MNHYIPTPRTQLRLINHTDLAVIHALHSIPEVDAYNTLGIPKDIEETQTIIEPWIAAHQLDKITRYTFAIESSPKADFIGLFGMNLKVEKYQSAEIWYKIHPAHWNKGIATEVLIAMIDFAFKELGLHRVEAGCAVENIGSIRVLEKAGMQREGRSRKILPLKSGWSDNFIYAILDTD